MPMGLKWCTKFIQKKNQFIKKKQKNNYTTIQMFVVGKMFNAFEKSYNHKIIIL